MFGFNHAKHANHASGLRLRPHQEPLDPLLDPLSLREHAKCSGLAPDALEGLGTGTQGSALGNMMLPNVARSIYVAFPFFSFPQSRVLPLFVF